MAFRHISELAGDVMRRVEMKRAVEGSAGDALTPRSTAGKGIGDQPNRGGVTIEPVAFVGEGAPTNSGIESGGATDFSPTKLPPLWKTPQGGVRLGGFVKAAMDMTTAYRRNESDAPRSAVVISLAMYRAQRRAVLGLGQHHSHPFALATLSASKASPTTASRPKYTNLLIAQPTQE